MWEPRVGDVVTFRGKSVGRWARVTASEDDRVTLEVHQAGVDPYPMVVRLSTCVDRFVLLRRAVEVGS